MSLSDEQRAKWEAKRIAVANMVGKTVTAVEFADFPEDESSTGRDYERIVIEFSDDSRVVIQSADPSEYASWLEVKEEAA